jgi:hypothetical protein
MPLLILMPFLMPFLIVLLILLLFFALDLGSWIAHILK